MNIFSKIRSKLFPPFPPCEYCTTKKEQWNRSERFVFTLELHNGETAELVADLIGSHIHRRGLHGKINYVITPEEKAEERVTELLRSAIRIGNKYYGPSGIVSVTYKKLGKDENGRKNP